MALGRVITGTSRGNFMAYNVEDPAIYSRRRCDADACLPNPAASGILLHTMKNRIGVIVLVLVLVCVGLGIALIAIKKQAGRASSATMRRRAARCRTIWCRSTTSSIGRSKSTPTCTATGTSAMKEFEELTNNYVESLATLSQVSNNLDQDRGCAQDQPGGDGQARRQDRRVGGAKSGAGQASR